MVAMMEKLPEVLRRNHRAPSVGNRTTGLSPYRSVNIGLLEEWPVLLYISKESPLDGRTILQVQDKTILILRFLTLKAF